MKLREAVEADDYDRMIASADRLHEEITAADATLERLLTPKATDYRSISYSPLRVCKASDGLTVKRDRPRASVYLPETERLRPDRREGSTGLYSRILARGENDGKQG